MLASCSALTAASERCFLTIMLLPSATKLRQGNIFTSVCQEFCSQGGGGVCVSACWDTPPAWAVHAGIHPTCPVHAGIDMATAADGAHPTGMHSCLCCYYFSL